MFGAFERRVVEQIAPLVADPLIGAVLAAGSRPGANTPTTWAAAWPRRATSWRARLGVGDAGGPAKQGMRGRGVSVAHGPFAGPLAASFVHVHNEAVARVSAGVPRPQRFASGARAGRRGVLAGSPAVGLDGRRPPPAASFRPHPRATKSCFPTGKRGRPGCRCRPMATPAGRSSDSWNSQRGGVRIRSRALVTTLWARLALGDLFIHGIGGAKYDRVTDLLIERFFGLRPPGLLVLSATLHLPIERDRVHGRRRAGDPAAVARPDLPSRAVSSTVPTRRRPPICWPTSGGGLKRRRLRKMRGSAAAPSARSNARVAALARRPAAATPAGTAGRGAARASGGKTCWPGGNTPFASIRKSTLRGFLSGLLHKTA